MEFKLQASGGVESPPEVPMFSFAERVHLEAEGKDAGAVLCLCMSSVLKSAI